MTMKLKIKSVKITSQEVVGHFENWHVFLKIDTKSVMTLKDVVTKALWLAIQHCSYCLLWYGFVMPSYEIMIYEYSRKIFATI